MLKIFLLVFLLWLSIASLAQGRELDRLARFEGWSIQRLEIEGNRFTRDFVILRELRTRIGGRLDLQVMRQDLRRLDNLDIFSSVQVEARPEGEGIALLLRVREIPFMVPYLSYDVSDQDGWSFGPAVKAVNMLGRDLFVAGYALFGGRTSFMLDLSYPWIAGNHLSLDLDAARVVRENELDGFEETSLEFSPWVGTYLGEKGRAGVGFSYLRFASDRPGHLLSGGEVDRLFQVGGRLGFDSRDVWGDPHQGWQNEVQVVRTGGSLPGEGDYWTVHLDARRYQPVRTGQTLVLAGLVSLQTGQVGRDIPEYLDFHLGGSNSLRGYALDELGQYLFGRNQWLGTLEYRFALLPGREYEFLGLPADLGLAGALFADHGLAWSAREDLDMDRARTGFGLGLRLLMPAIEMSRLDLGFDRDGNWRIHFASFSKLTAQRLRLR